MRSIIKMLGLAFFATLALSAMGALGAGSASALLFLTTNAKESFTVKGLTIAELETKGKNTIECANVLGNGLILNKTDVAHSIFLIFHKCNIKGLPSATCTSAGEPAGLIKTLQLDALLVTLLPSTSDKYGLLLLAAKGNLAEFKCASLPETNAEVKGTVVGEFTETLTESQTAKKEATLKFEKGANAGEPAITSYWTLQGTAAPKLESTLSGLANETSESNEKVTSDVVATNNVSFCHN